MAFSIFYKHTNQGSSSCLHCGLQLKERMNVTSLVTKIELKKGNFLFTMTSIIKFYQILKRNL